MNRRLLSLLLFSALSFSSSYSQSTTPIRPFSELGAVDLKLTDSMLCEYSDVCVDRSGNVWVAYMELEKAQEKIVLVQVRDRQIKATYQVSQATGFEYAPRICCDAKNRIWIVWSAKRNNNWDLYARIFERGEFSSEIRITDHPEVDIHPSIASDSQGNVWVAWESLHNGNFDIYAMMIRGTEVGTPVAISQSPQMDLRPAILSAGNDLFVAWDRQEGATYQILMRGMKGKTWRPETVVSPRKGFNMAPALAMQGGKLTIAWHSNLQPDGTVGITPWIYLQTYQDGKEGKLYTTAQAGDWVKNGEDQGLEFPNLLIDKKGALWLFTRPSQGFYAQVVRGDKVSVLYQCNVEGWGGRGQHMRAVLADDGTIYSVRRDINYIYLNEFKPGEKSVVLSHNLQAVRFPSYNSTQDQPRIQAQLKRKLQLPDKKQILYGDIHQHSSISDGMGTVDQCYTRSRYVHGYDFASLTDHDWFTGNQMLPSEWEWIKIVGKQFDRPGEFITVAAYEWTTPRPPRGFGHKNVYFPDWEQPVFSYRTDATNTVDLFRLLRSISALAFPHHIGWTGVDWENHDPDVQSCSEIVSTHGAFEYMGNEPIAHRGGMPGNFIQDGLARGLKFGLTGSTDGHGLRWHHGIGRKEEEWETGLTGALVAEKTKDAVFKALRDRSVFATSGPAIQMNFTINGRPMGSEVNTSTAPDIVIDVLGTARLRYVVLVRDNKEILFMGKDFDEGYGVKRSFVDECATVGKHWYYLRVIQEDGEMAWSSPIWVIVQ